jgi:magnesium chelatase family protein
MGARRGFLSFAFVVVISGRKAPRPSEVSLAHHGILFLDELPECRRRVLEVLRQPLEEGMVTISHAYQ